MQWVSMTEVTPAIAPIVTALLRLGFFSVVVSRGRIKVMVYIGGVFDFTENSQGGSLLT